MGKEWLFLVDEAALPGSLNMAIDEFLFRSLGDEAQTFLRFYRWERPTVSLGYSQNIERVVDLDFCRSHGIDIVRRMTGGKLVLHDKEITYSICSSDTQMFTAFLGESYRLISEALICGLAKTGITASLAGSTPSFYSRGNMPCFSHPARDEIEVNGQKLVGSAQKRIGPKFLQHGSIPLEGEGDLLEKVSSWSGLRKQLKMTSLTDILGSAANFSWAVDCLAAGFSDYFKVSLKPLHFEKKQKEEIFRLQNERYANPDWTLKGKDAKSIDFFEAK